MKDQTFSDESPSAATSGLEPTRTLARVLDKALLLMSSTVTTACLSWWLAGNCPTLGAFMVSASEPLLLGLLFILALTICLESWAPVTVPLLAVTSGVVMATYTFLWWDIYSASPIPFLALSFVPLGTVVAAHACGIVAGKQNASIAFIGSLCGVILAYLIGLIHEWLGIPLLYVDLTDLRAMVLIEIVPGTFLGYQLIVLRKKAISHLCQEWYNAFKLLLFPLVMFMVLFLAYAPPWASY